MPSTNYAAIFFSLILTEIFTRFIEVIKKQKGVQEVVPMAKVVGSHARTTSARKQAAGTFINNRPV